MHLPVVLATVMRISCMRVNERGMRYPVNLTADIRELIVVKRRMPLRGDDVDGDIAFITGNAALRVVPALNPGIDDPITIVFFDLLLKYGMRPAQLDSECHRVGKY